MVQHNLLRRDMPNGKGVVVGTYVDEGFGGASDMDTFHWLMKGIEKEFPITVQMVWEPMLGFGCAVDDATGCVEFSGKKYILKLVEQFLPGEAQPKRVSAARETIMQLPAEPVPMPGSADELALAPIQHEARSLGGGLAHLSRIRIDISFAHSWISQGTAHPTAKHLEHFKEVLRYAWTTIDHVHRHQCKQGLQLHDGEVVRPYDTTLPAPRIATPERHSADTLIEYGCYGILDAAQSVPGINVVNSKSMGGLAIMLGGAAIAWKAWRFHTVVVDSTSGEMLATSRCVTLLYYHRRVNIFIGIPQDKPTPVLTDNDGVWSIAKDATGTTSLIYIIRHVRFVQQAQEHGEIKVEQVDGRINPTDGLTKWVPTATSKRDNMFLMGYAQEAYKFWVASKVFQQFKPRKIVPPPQPPIEVAPALRVTNNVRVTQPTVVSSALSSVVPEAQVLMATANVLKMKRDDTSEVQPRKARMVVEGCMAPLDEYPAWSSA